MTFITRRKITAGALTICAAAAIASMLVLPGMAMAHEGEPVPPVEQEPVVLEAPAEKSEGSGLLIAGGAAVILMTSAASFAWIRRRKN